MLTPPPPTPLYIFLQDRKENQYGPFPAKQLVEAHNAGYINDRKVLVKEARMKGEFRPMGEQLGVPRGGTEGWGGASRLGRGPFCVEYSFGRKGADVKRDSFQHRVVNGDC